MTMISIPVPEDLEDVLKPVLERDPRKGRNGCELGLRPTSPNCTSNGRHSTSRRHALRNCWGSVRGHWTTCYRCGA